MAREDYDVQWQKLMRGERLARRDAAQTCRHWTRAEIEASPYVQPEYQQALFRRAQEGGNASEYTATGIFYSL